MDKWIKKMWHIYTVKFYSAIKNNATVVCWKKDGTADNHVE
jgi:hypothetical protein